MRKILLLIAINFFLTCFSCSAQFQIVVDNIVDECFTSQPAQTDFPSGFDLANDNADLMQWTGSAWVGAWTNAFIAIPPPTNRLGCRAIFIGSGSLWTAPGEWFAFRLNQPLVEGQTYSLIFTYVSHGYGSDGAFSPKISTNALPTLTGEVNITSLPAAGTSWTTNSISFTATNAQVNHEWVIVKTDVTVSSGMVSSFCEGCFMTFTNVNEKEAERFNVYPNPASSVLSVDLMKKGMNEIAWSIYNSTGQVVMESTEPVTESLKKDIDVSSLHPGLYMFNVNAGGEKLSKNFIKQ